MLLTAGCGEQTEKNAAPQETSLASPEAPKTKSPPAKPDQTKLKKSGTSKRRSIAAPALDAAQAKRVDHYANRLREREQTSKARSSISDAANGRSTGELLATLRSPAAESTERVAAMVELGGRDDPQALNLLRDLASSTQLSAAERVGALEALAELPQAAHLPAVAAALAATDEEVQTAAVWLLTQIHSEAALPLWQQVMTHPSAEVVALAFEALPDAADWFQEQAATVALRRAEPWIQERAILTLGGITSKPAVESLIPLIDHPTSGDLAHDGLMFLLGESFHSSTAARRWWRDNQRSLDASLQLIE
jgi:hypothetical protein